MSKDKLVENFRLCASTEKSRGAIKDLLLYEIGKNQTTLEKTTDVVIVHQSQGRIAQLRLLLSYLEGT